MPLTIPSGSVLQTDFGDLQLSRAMLKDNGNVYVDKGNSGTSTQTFDMTAGSHQQVTATGSHTWAVSGWPPTGNTGYIQIRYVNAGSYTLTSPTINWQLPTGGHTTVFATYMTAIGRTALQTSGIDEWVLWSSNSGTDIYGKIL